MKVPVRHELPERKRPSIIRRRERQVVKQCDAADGSTPAVGCRAHFRLDYYSLNRTGAFGKDFDAPPASGVPGRFPAGMKRVAR